MHNLPVHILLVEDEPDHVELILRAFGYEEHKFKLSVVSTLAAAGDFARTNPTDIAITDWLLPDGEGLDLLRSRLLRPEIPVIVMTSHGNERVAVEAIRAGALDYIVKSDSTLSDMPHIVERALRQWENITERQRAEQAFKENDRKLRQITDNMLDIICQLNADGIAHYVSPSIKNVLGYQPEEITGQNVYDFVHPDDLPTIFETIASSETRQTTIRVEFRFRHAHDYYLWLEANANPLFDSAGKVESGIVSARDISQRKQAEALLKESEARYRAIMEQSYDAIFLIDPDTHRILEANPAFKKLLGYTEADLAGLVFDELILADPKVIDENIRQIMANERHYVGEIKYTCVNLPVPFRFLETSSSRVVYGNREVICSVARDVSERKELEDQLLQAQKLQAVGQLAGGIAHDFNNLLSVILSYSESLLSFPVDDVEEIRESIREIESAGKRAASLTRQLLTFSRRAVFDLQVLNLNTVIDDVSKMLQRLAGGEIKLVIDVEPDLRPVKGDIGQLEQVLVNLVVNARDAMPRGGKLTIHTCNTWIDEETSRQQLQIAPGHYVVLEVSDNGIGMDRATLERIFEPFYTTKPRGQGTGLGLATVHGIVTQFSGHIRVDSEPGRGTSFKIFFPPAEQAQPETTQTVPPPPTEAVTGTVLLVEDDLSVRRLTRIVLENNGYKVLEAESQLAEQFCLKYGGGINLLLTDVVMPGLNGQELAARLTALRPDLKVLYMSGYSDNILLSYGVTPQTFHFLQKPFKPYTLIEKIQAVLDGTDN